MRNDIKECIYLGDLRIIPVIPRENCTDYIRSGQLSNLEELHKKIERRTKHYRLDSLLLKIHDSAIAKECPNFIAALMTRYAVLNSNTYTGLTPIYDEEFINLRQMITEYSLYDPEFENERNSTNSQEEDEWASFFLRKAGNQARFNVPLHNMFGRTRYLYDEMLNNEETPDFIKEIINIKFENIFGLPLIDFIDIGFLLTAASRANKGGLDRGYFEKARELGIPIPNDDIIKLCLKHVTCDQNKYKKICKERELGEEYLRAYKFNPLLEYPIIRPWNCSDKKDPKNDKFIAPVPDLLIYRFTVGLYYQLFNTFGTKFTDAFGDLFGLYVGEILKWYNLQGKVLSEQDVKQHLENYTGRKYTGKIPEWVILCDDGVILIECKATKYTQDVYEHGLNANNKTFIKQIKKAITQLNTFEAKIPELIKACEFGYTEVQTQKLIVTFEPLWGLECGPVRNHIIKNVQVGGPKSDWKILWVWLLEEVQPYIAKGANFWSFLLDHDQKTYNRLNEIVDDMRTKTNASYTDSVLSKYEDKILNELTRDGTLLEQNDE